MKNIVKLLLIVLTIAILIITIVAIININLSKEEIDNNLKNELFNNGNQSNNSEFTEVEYMKKIEDLPKDYTTEQAVIDNCIVSANGNKIYNKDELDRFLENVNNNVPDFARFINYTVEGDMIITDVNFEGSNNFRVCIDSTRDKWSAESDRTYKNYIFTKLTTEDKEDSISIYLQSPVNGEQIEIKLISYMKDAQVINDYTNSAAISHVGVTTALSLDDEIQDDTIWCGTFQLIWNDLKNDFVKQDIVFNPQLKVPSIALKQEIEKAIKEKFNETSDILDNFNWNVKGDSLFLYAMLKKEFRFEKVFDELDSGKFGNYENTKYFGIKENADDFKKQIEVLYYNSKDDFAIKLTTEKEDEIILCKNPVGKNFNEIYKNISNKQKNYNGNKNIKKSERLKIPYLKVKEKNEFTEIENKVFPFSSGENYQITKAIQTIEFELDKTGGKIKSEAGMSVEKSEILENEIREFFIDNTFAIFLKEENKDTPYFAGKINDITKFQ